MVSDSDLPPDPPLPAIRHRIADEIEEHFPVPGAWSAAIERCTDKGVKERPPVPGFTYRAFVVHPPNVSGQKTLAVLHAI